MNTMWADFNWITEAGHVCLTTIGSQAEIQRHGIQPGDWVWLSDGELIVGALVTTDARYKLVGIADWETLVHLDDEAANNRDCIDAELKQLLAKNETSDQEEQRIFELLAQLEYASPDRFQDAALGFLAFRRALALRRMGKLGLAVIELKQARRDLPYDSTVEFVYFDLLRRHNFPSAVAEAESIVNLLDLPAPVMSACINILTIQAEEASVEEFDSIAQRVFALCGRFDQSPDLEEAGPSLIALSHFNRGLVHLRAGRAELARQAFEKAEQVYPIGLTTDEMIGLETRGEPARQVARRVREKVAAQYLLRPLAA